MLKIDRKDLKHVNNQNGFSLLELLIYISIIAVITLVISSVFIFFNRGRGQVEARNAVNTNLNFAITKISQDLKSASAVATPAIAGNSSSDLTMTVGGIAVTYCVADGQLRRKAGGGACDAASETVTADTVVVGAPVFTRLENTNSVLPKTIVSIEVSMNMTYNSSSTDWQYSETKKTTTSLR